MSALELYQQTIKSMPSSQRLRLASLILHDLSEATGPVDESGEWTEADLADVSRASLQHIAHQMWEDDADAG